ncbi:MAG TPA: LCP family protein [Gaiellaceae bacterium]|jgi:LCP family protein required for cell wall assembly|nr:LCP family protein [Gaiellaceae bacterium]
MAREDKPYRVYRGGRATGGVPTLSRQPKPERRRKPPREAPKPQRYAGPGPAKRPRRFGVGRIVTLTILALVLLLIGWTVAGYLAVGNGMEEANARLGDEAKAQLASQDGWMLSQPSTTLIVGSDHSSHPTRRGNRLADSIMLLRTDPDHHSISYLSIPRDLELEIPGHGRDKINSTLPVGGPQLTIRTVQEALGVPVNHIILLDMTAFRKVVDALDGVEVDVRKPAVTKVECPYSSAARCERWGGWRFGRGRQEMDGKRAQIYSRIRTNLLDPGESDLNRVGRQQQVLQATLDEMVSFGTYLRLPFIGEDLVSPLTTDLSQNELFQLAWLRFRSADDRTTYCRLGVTGDGDDNAAVVLMFTGRSAIQPPTPTTGAGCLRGTPLT